MNNFLNIKNAKYILLVNKKQTDIIISRLISFSDIYENLIKSLKIYNHNKGYFFYNKKGFNSFFYNAEYDIIFVNNDNKVIYLEKNFKTNKISNYYPYAKFLYILPPKSIEKNNLKINDIIKKTRTRKKIVGFYNNI